MKDRLSGEHALISLDQFFRRCKNIIRISRQILEIFKIWRVLLGIKRDRNIFAPALFRDLMETQIRLSPLFSRARPFSVQTMPNGSDQQKIQFAKRLFCYIRPDIAQVTGILIVIVEKRIGNHADLIW